MFYGGEMAAWVHVGTAFALGTIGFGIAMIRSYINEKEHEEDMVTPIRLNLLCYLLTFSSLLEVSLKRGNKANVSLLHATEKTSYG
ncbi:hypothetical protein [Bacillus anthracis]|uniref:Uncharacterized protein n=1 Tax=Bacillus anthracis TaxID=1392 RepID=A0A0J1HJY6_BACAN|nr:hypothetical protein [Bacillus anthracis]KLV14077.1 hypothetical protein ABW01_28865 [Bacillus anthracis]